MDHTWKNEKRVLRFIYLNSYFDAGIKRPLDDAILKHEHKSQCSQFVNNI